MRFAWCELQWKWHVFEFPSQRRNHTGFGIENLELTLEANNKPYYYYFHQIIVSLIPLTSQTIPVMLCAMVVAEIGRLLMLARLAFMSSVRTQPKVKKIVFVSLSELSCTTIAPNFHCRLTVFAPRHTHTSYTRTSRKTLLRANVCVLNGDIKIKSPAPLLHIAAMAQ